MEFLALKLPELIRKPHDLLETPIVVTSISGFAGADLRKF